MNRQRGLLLVFLSLSFSLLGCEVVMEELAKNLETSRVPVRVQTSSSSSSPQAGQWAPTGNLSKDIIGQWKKLGSSETIEFMGKGQVVFTGEMHRMLGSGLAGGYKIAGPNIIKVFIAGYTPMEESIRVSFRGSKMILTRPELGVTTYERVLGADSYAVSQNIEQEIIGKWHCPEDRDTYEFLADGTMVYIGPLLSTAGTYRLIGSSQLAIEARQGSAIYKVAMRGDTLVLEHPSSRMVAKYRRVK